ncbi:MAG: AraC family transcriptional regulator ligand-binding domain-containing protein [Motiliproteus sp.]
MSAILATASAKLIDPVIQVARHSQQDPGALLASVGIDPEHIAHSGARIPAALFSSLLLELAQRTGNPRLALRIGEATQPRMLGSVGFLMSTAANLRQAYQLLNDYLPLLIEGVHLSLEQEAEQVTLVLDLADDNDRPLVEWLLAGLHNWTRWLTGKQVPLVNVDFAFPEPASAQSYEQFFAAEVRFNADRNRLRFSASHLELRCLDANEEMQRLHQSFADQLLSSAGRDGTLVAQIKSLIRNQLSSHQAISRQQVAAHLNLSLRTMQRKLDQQGTPFQTLFDQTRKDLALQLIQRGDSSFGEIAFQLGFSGLSAFQKAFKRWTGMAPGAYRNAQRPVTILPVRSQPRALSDLIGTHGVVEEQFYPLALQLLTQISEWQQRNLKRPLLSPARIGISSDDQQDYRLTLIDPEPLNRPELLEQLNYEAPETSLALPYAVDQRSELYQLGCLFYCLLHGHPPYQAPDPGELLQAHLQQSPVLNPNLSTALSRILIKLLALPAEERYQSLTGLQSDLK